MQFLTQYEKESGHAINKQKSGFIVGEGTLNSRCQTIASIMGFTKKSMPTKYLGCNFFVGRKKSAYFGDLIVKMEKKLAGWNGKLLSHGSRLTLIKHVLQSVHIHICAAFSPPKPVISRLESIFSNFF